MAEIVPAVLAASIEDYRKDLGLAIGLSARIQVDLADGVFAPNQTISLVQADWPEGTVVDLHLMLEDPLAQLPTVVVKQPHMAIFHAEALSDNLVADVMALNKELHIHGIKVGLALLPETTVESVSEAIPLLDHILIFTGNLGHYGGDMRLDLLQKCGQVKDIEPGLEVGVDGGVNLGNAVEAAGAGFDVLNIGSYLQHAADPKKAYDKLESVIKK